MKRLNGSYKSCYYLTEDGRLYNEDTKEYTAADKRNNFYIEEETGGKKKISLCKLYAAIYNKPYSIDNVDTLDNEEWREIDNTNGKYYVSSKGRIKSYARKQALLMRPALTNNGYLRVEIKQEDIRANKLVHRLVAAAFLEKPGNIEMQLHHKDFNKLNNAADNLEWLTPAQHRQKHLERQAKG